MVNDKTKLRQNDEEGAAGRRGGGGDLDGGGNSVGDDNCNANLAKRKDVMMGSDSEIMTIDKQTRALNNNNNNNNIINGNNSNNNNSNNNNRNKNNTKYNSNSNSNSNPNSGARTMQNKNGVKSNNVKKSNASKNSNRSTGSNRASVSGNKNNNNSNGNGGGDKCNVSSDNKKPLLLSWRIPLPVNDDIPTVNNRNKDIKRDEKFVRDLQNSDKNSTTTIIANLATDMISTNAIQTTPTTTTTTATPIANGTGTSTAITTSCVKCAPQNAFNVSGPYTYSRLFRGGKQYQLPKISDHLNNTNSKQNQQQNRSNSNYSTTSTATNNKLGDNTNNNNINSRYFKKDNMQKNQNLTKFMPIPLPLKPIKSCSDIDMVTAGVNGLVIFEKTGNGRRSYPLMQSGTLEVPETFCRQRLSRMDSLQIDDGFHSDGGTETPPLSPSSGGSITSDHGSYENVVDTSPGAQRLAVLSFEQCRKLNDVMNESVAIHGHGNFPVLEVKLKDLVNLVRRKLETDLQSGGAGMVVKDIRLNGGAASHVLASEDQQYNDLDLIFAVDIGSSRHFDRVKTAVLNVLMDLLPEGVSRRRITPCSLKEAYVGKMVKVNNNLDGDRWSLISLGNSPGHKNVELKFVDTMRRQFEFSVDSFQIVLDSLMLFYDCTTLPISENFYPTVVGESVYGDFQEALYHLQKKLISTRQPEEIRGGGLLKYCNLLVRNYKAVNEEKIKNLERYMCSRFFIDFPDYSIQRNKLEAYLRNHFWGIEEEPLQYQYLMHLREVVEMSTVCLMNHERRQTIQLIQSLAMQVLCREQQKQYQAAQAALDEYQEQHSTSADNTNLQHQQSSQSNHQQHQQQQLICTTSTPTCCEQPNQTQTTQQTNVPQTIQIQPGPPGLIYANGVYYAPVISTTICTCNSTWLST